MTDTLCDECKRVLTDGAQVCIVDGNPTRILHHTACAECWPHAERESWARDARASGRKVTVTVIGPA